MTGDASINNTMQRSSEANLDATTMQQCSITKGKGLDVGKFGRKMMQQLSETHALINYKWGDIIRQLPGSTCSLFAKKTPDDQKILRLLNTAVPLKLQFSENDARILERVNVQNLRVQLLKKKCKVTLPSVVAFSRLFVAVGKCKNRRWKKSMQQLQDLLTHSSVAAFSRLFPSRVFFLWKLHFFLLPSCTWRWQAQRVHQGLHLLLLLSVSKFPNPTNAQKKIRDSISTPPHPLYLSQSAPNPPNWQEN